MSITIGIDQNTCIKCGKCVKVCPSVIFIQQETDKTVETENINSCIGCGHCAAVCPTGSVLHSEFQENKLHAIDYSQLPAPEQMMLLCKTRRSNRTLTAKPIPADMLNKILEAAHCAPTATNSQNVSFTLVTDPQKLLLISNFTIGVFDSLLRKLKFPFLKTILKRIMPDIYKYVPAFERLKRDHLAGKDPILRKATALLLIHTPKSNRFGCEDANLAYQNASLMAECLGVSQIYMGFVLVAIKQENKDSLAKSLGINGKIHAVMALGMPSFRYPNYTDRNDIVVNRI